MASLHGCLIPSDVCGSTDGMGGKPPLLRGFRIIYRLFCGTGSAEVMDEHFLSVVSVSSVACYGARIAQR